jgi:hypothetical protein
LTQLRGGLGFSGGARNTSPMASTEKTRVWLNFDLGFDGDWEGLYQFLADHDAKECGANSATFFWPTKNLKNSLQKALRDAVKIDKRSKIYAIYKAPDGMHASFMFGKRRSPKWTGYSSSESSVDEGG